MTRPISQTILRVFLILNLSLLVASQGTQFITGVCAKDSDCMSACCGFTSGTCAGPIVAQERDGGCGFGESQPNDDAAQAFRAGQAAANPPTPTTLVTAVFTAVTPVPEAATPIPGAVTPVTPVTAGTQFITGACTADSDCASSCCGFNSGKCAGPIVAQERDGGCGFGAAQPNDRAAKALTG